MTPKPGRVLASGAFGREATLSLGRVRTYKPFIITTIAYLLIMQVGLYVLLVPKALQGSPDFRHLYTAGYMVRSGYAHQLYDSDVNHQLQTELAGPLKIPFTFDHLAYESLFFAPLSLLRFKTGYILFFGINLTMLAACFFMLRSYMCTLGKIWKWLPPAIFVCFYPVTVALIQGQDSILMLTLLIAGFLSHQRKQSFWAGALVGLTLFKFQFSIPILILCLAWKWWRFAIGFLTSSVAVSALSVWIAGFAGTVVYLRSLLSMSVGLKTGEQEGFYGIHPSLMPNLRGLFSVAAGPYVSHFWVQALTMIFSALLIFVAARSRPSLSLAIVVSVLVSYHGLIHDASLLLAPIALLGAASLERSWRSARWTLGLVALILILPTMLMLASGPYWLLALPVLALLAVYTFQENLEIPCTLGQELMFRHQNASLL